MIAKIKNAVGSFRDVHLRGLIGFVLFVTTLVTASMLYVTSGGITEIKFDQTTQIGAAVIGLAYIMFRFAPSTGRFIRRLGEGSKFVIAGTAVRVLGPLLAVFLATGALNNVPTRHSASLAMGVLAMLIWVSSLWKLQSRAGASPVDYVVDDEEEIPAVERTMALPRITAPVADDSAVMAHEETDVASPPRGLLKVQAAVAQQ